tara:strand:+ start:57 stop:434 length:378 start_codon:yes stop_codon:yes gene_type:complete
MTDEDKEFGDFKEVKEEEPKKPEQPGMEEQVPTRIRTPRDGQIMGVVEQRLGGNRMDIKCSDGKNRNCRVPGRFKRRFWLRDGDVVLIVPWEDDDSKGDIVFQYRKNEKAQLKKKGMLDFANEGF